MESTALSTVGFVPLSRGMLAMVDANDLPTVNRFRWHAVQSRTFTVYAAACGGNRSRAMIGRRHFRMHSLLLGFPDVVDHVSGFGLDNRRANIRPWTGQQNQYNSRKGSGKTSMFKGVSWHRGSGRWQVFVSRHGRPKYVGSSTSEADAARMYDAAAIELYGEFARPNFPAASRLQIHPTQEPVQ